MEHLADGFILQGQVWRIILANLVAQTFLALRSSTSIGDILDTLAIT